MHVVVDIVFTVYGVAAVVIGGMVLTCWISSRFKSRIPEISEHDEDVAEALAASE